MITSMYDFREENGNIMPYKQYEERKIMEAAELAEKLDKGEIEGIPLEVFMKKLDELMERIEKEHKNTENEEIKIAY